MENLNINCEDFEKKCVKFIDDYVKRNKVKCMVLGVSGGIDSAVCAYLLAKVNIGKIFVIMPMNGITPPEDIKDAKEISKILNVETTDIEINHMVEKFKEILNFDDEEDKKTIGNLTARVRMCLLYAIANKNNGIVCGTGDKSEILIGYFTKYGDGGCDIMPIADLYKTQVKILAKHLGISEKIIAKKSSPRLWKNQKASDEIGMDYEEIDKILVLMEKGMDKDKISEETGILTKKVEKIYQMNKISQHKRNLPAGFKFF
ncbi:NH(3)-dependent NAD(+) synthetase [groundwater metagenome]|uniref:NH(3)-dependent NAD(+) synthetase n=1 Tax=groundwater metagenome TaxID=717931 RepID=A0A098EAG1_9ZZZZ